MMNIKSQAQYSIDDEHGTLITGPHPGYRVMGIAREAAHKRGKPVYVYEVIHGYTVDGPEAIEVLPS